MSSTSHHHPGAGDVTITLGREEYTLLATLGAAIEISRAAGGIRRAMTRVADLDLDAITLVIRLGLEPAEAKKIKNLERMIWENGLLDAQGMLVARCIDYLGNLARGGAPAGAEEEAQSSEDPPTMQ